MTVLLDTSVLIDISHGVFAAIDIDQEVAIPFMAYFEYYDGLTDKSEKSRKRLLKLLDEFSLLTATRETAEIAATLKKNHARSGFTMGFGDLLIAAQAIEHDLVLVTKDVAFKRIKELNVVIV